MSLATPLSQSPEEAVLAGLARPARHPGGGGDRDGVDHSLPQRDRGLRARRRLVARYEKVHRVPFGEYVPDRRFFSHLANLSAVPLDAIPGTATGLLPTPAAPLGAMVSYEVFFADRGRSSSRAGAQLLVVPTNTSSYCTAQVPTQEIAASGSRPCSRDAISCRPRRPGTALPSPTGGCC